jgi:hypothetical protein
MKNGLKSRVIAIVVVSLLSITNFAYCDSGSSYEESVAQVRETMTFHTSLFRQESYGYIEFDNCKLNYNVVGMYPAGGPYNIKYNNIDLSTFNPTQSKTGHDYTAYVVLNFDKNLEYRSTVNTLQIRTIVINVSDDQASQTLLNGFTRLGQLCNLSTAGNEALQQ